MTYRIVGYGPRKSCLTWAEDDDLNVTKQYLELEGYTDFRIEEEAND